MKRTSADSVRTACVPLARASLVMSSLIVAGCLDDPPTFAPRGQIPPFILAHEVVPELGLIYDEPGPIDINVPFRSEDVNVELEARLYLDLLPGAAGGNPVVNQGIAPSIYEDESRSVVVSWTRPVEGCHSITMILTYANNYDISGLPIDDSRAARVVWWVNIEEIPGETLMSSCPTAPPSDPE